jgi:hypothetical protein
MYSLIVQVGLCMRAHPRFRSYAELFPEFRDGENLTQSRKPLSSKIAYDTDNVSRAVAIYNFNLFTHLLDRKAGYYRKLENWQSDVSLWFFVFQIFSGAFGTNSAKPIETRVNKR